MRKLIGSRAVVLAFFMLFSCNSASQTLPPQFQADKDFKIDDRAYPKLGAVWASNIVTVCWENEQEITDNDKLIVRMAIEQSWMKYSALEFVGWGKCGAGAVDLRIKVADAEPRTRGLGKENRNLPHAMLLNFKFQNWGRSCRSTRKKCIVAIAVHEFGHAIGYAHEQNRPDAPGECLRKQPRQGERGDDHSLTPWDLASVMNYCNPKFHNNGVLSLYDRQTVARIYK